MGKVIVIAISLFYLTTVLHAAEPIEKLFNINTIVRDAGVPPAASCAGENRPKSTVAVDSQPEESNTIRWNKAGFGSPALTVLDSSDLYSSQSPVKFTHQFQMTSVVFRNAGWTVEQAVQKVKNTAWIFSQCGIKISKAIIVETDAPNGWIDVDDTVEQGRTGRSFEITKRLPLVDRPILFHVRSSESSSLAYANPVCWTGADSPLANTAWITTKANSPEYKKEKNGEYEVEAHEIGHILGNWDAKVAFGHRYLDDENIMGPGTGRYGNRFDENQCKDMKKSPLLTRMRRP